MLASNAGAMPIAQGAPVARDAVETPLVALINEVRADRGLRPLRSSRALARAAAGHASAMGRLGFFAHESPDGTSATERIRKRYRGTSFGETILWRSPDVTPEQALAMWMTSPPHRRVLLASSFRDIGVAAVHVEGAGGAFDGMDVTIVVADFGGR
jgi:uncharacterized protein YkwD